jgi:hypothetical protein
MDAELRARHREQPSRSRSECGRSEHPGRRARLDPGPATLANRRRPGFSLVRDSHPRSGATE